MTLSSISLKLPVPALQGQFGDLLACYSTQIRATDVRNFLGHDPRSQNWKKLPDDVRQIYEYLQRKTAKSRRDSISGYIEERFGNDAVTVGAFPAISVAFQSPIEFVSSENGIGTLMVDLSPDQVRIVIDGLGRVTGALDVYDEGNKSILENFTFPLTIYAPKPGAKPLTWEQMGQLFHDMNFRVQPVSKQQAIALDKSDLYIQLAERLGECNFIHTNGGVAKKAASLGNKSTELVVQTVLVRTMRGACEGRKFQEANLATVDNPYLNRSNLNSVAASIEGFFEKFATAMGKDRFTDRSSMHLASPGWQALGVIYHDAKHKLDMDQAAIEKLATEIAAFDWSRHNPEWIECGLVQPEIDKMTGNPAKDEKGNPKVIITGGGRLNVQKLIDYVREKTGLSAKLGDKADHDDAQDVGELEVAA